MTSLRSPAPADDGRPRLVAPTGRLRRMLLWGLDRPWGGWALVTVITAVIVVVLAG